MSAEKKGAQDSRTQAIVDAIDEWLGTLPTGTFRKRVLEIPDDDEYGFDTLFALEPIRPDACPIELGVTVPAAGSAVALFLDTWENVARRVGGELSPDKAARPALFLEPTPMLVGRVIEACIAVAGGSVHLDAGLFRRRLVCTSGWLDTHPGHVDMHGVEDYLLPILRTMTLAGIAKVETLRYEPWV